MEINNLKPPVTNRGVENTSDDTLNALIDWVQVTFNSGQNLSKVFSIFGLDELEFMETTGKYGYKKCMRKAHISIYYDGAENMGVHVEMTGQGVREYELVKKDEWHEVFRKIILENGKFTRLDVAIDDIATKDRKLYFTVNQIKKLIKNKQCRSKFKLGRYMEEFEFKDATTLGETLYFGRPKSDLQIRLYEKDFERLAKGALLEEYVTGWNRFEVQARNDRAQSIANLIAKNDFPLGKIAIGIISNYIAFIKKSNDTNRSRADLLPFWKKFIRDVEKIKIAEILPEKTIESKEKWIMDTVKKSLAMVWYANGSKQEYIAELLDEGLKLLDADDINMINTYIDTKKFEEEMLLRIKINKYEVEQERLKARLLSKKLKKESANKNYTQEK